MSENLTTEPVGWAHDDIDDIDYDHALSNSGVDPDIQEVLRQQLAPPETDVEFLYRTRPSFEAKTIQAKLDELLERAEFDPMHGAWRIVKNFGKFAVQKAGEWLHYPEILRLAERKSGKTEAATFGTAKFSGQDCVVYAMNWAFMGGSMGEVAGEKMIAAIDMAKQRKLSLVSFYSSGGMRQHENATAVAQMQRDLALLSESYLNSTDLLHIAVIFGQVWGGTSASTVPQADVIIGVAGSDSGFAGPRVIENYQQEAVKPGMQSAESGYLTRQLHTIVAYEELEEYVAEYLRVAKPTSHPKKPSSDGPTLPHPVRERKLSLDAEGIAPVLFKNQPEGIISFASMQKPADDDFINYERLIRDAGRPDTDYLIRNVFDEAVPLYDHYVRGTKVTYPSIVGAIAKLDGQPFMVIGDQPSYDVLGGGSYVRKLGATPRPQDFRYVTRLMATAARLELPVVTFTDTLGAEPTIEAELNGQSEAISNAMKSLLSHRPPVVSIVTGALGSGGGLGTTRLGRLHALEDAQIYVAEPTSATSIVYGTNQPTKDQVVETLAGMGASAKQLHEEGFIHTLIPLGESRAEAARNIREAISQEYGFLSSKSERQRRDMGLRALRNLKRSTIDKPARQRQ